VPDLSNFWPIVAAFAALVAAGVGVPIPEELPTIGAGIWVGSNPELGPARWLILPVCFVGVLISDVLLYGIGRLWGPRLLEHKWVTRFMKPETRQRTERNFHHYGLKALLLVRWVPAIRSPMFITAGIMRLPLVLFILADGIAAVFGHSLLFFLAYWFGDQFRDLVMQVEYRLATTVRALLILTAIGAVAAYFTIHFFRRPVITGDPQEVPLIGEKVADKLSSPSVKIPLTQPVGGADSEASNHQPTAEGSSPTPPVPTEQSLKK
jgi:membrane protein DedA with SNARE-associated domain